MLGQRFELDALRLLGRIRTTTRAARGPSPRPAGGRGFPVRPCPDPGRGLRYPAQEPPARAASAGGGLVRGARPGAPRRAPRPGRGSRGAARLPRCSPSPRPPTTATSCAQRLVERGLALAVEPADRFALTCLQGDILHDLGAMSAAAVPTRARWRRRERQRAMPRLARARCGEAGYRRPRRRFADLDRAEAAADEQGLIAEQRARIHFLRGNLLFPRGDIEGCLREHRRAWIWRASGLGRARGDGARRPRRCRVHARSDDQRARRLQTLHRARRAAWSRSHRGRQPADGACARSYFQASAEVLRRGAAPAAAAARRSAICAPRSLPPGGQVFVCSCTHWASISRLKAESALSLIWFSGSVRAAFCKVASPMRQSRSSGGGHRAEAVRLAVAKTLDDRSPDRHRVHRSEHLGARPALSDLKRTAPMPWRRARQ